MSPCICFKTFLTTFNMFTILLCCYALFHALICHFVVKPHCFVVSICCVTLLLRFVVSFCYIVLFLSFVVSPCCTILLLHLIITPCCHTLLFHLENIFLVFIVSPCLLSHTLVLFDEYFLHQSFCLGLKMKNFKLFSSSLIRSSIFFFLFFKKHSCLWSFFHFVYMFFAFIALFIFPIYLFIFWSTYVLWVMHGFLAFGKKLHDPHSLYIYTYSIMHKDNNFVNDYKCFELYLFCSR